MAIISSDNFNSYPEGSLFGQNGGFGWGTGWFGTPSVAVLNPAVGNPNKIVSPQSSNARAARRTSFSGNVSKIVLQCYVKAINDSPNILLGLFDSASFYGISKLGPLSNLVIAVGGTNYATSNPFTSPSWYKIVFEMDYINSRRTTVYVNDTIIFSQPNTPVPSSVSFLDFSQDCSGFSPNIYYTDIIISDGQTNNSSFLQFM